MRDTEMAEFAALELEGYRRGLSYGKLVGSTTEAEREEIVRKYKRRQKEKEEGIHKRKATAR